jgi:putative peptidoglycan lipid II flippase
VGAVVTTAAIVVAARGFSAIKELVIAARFGVSDAVDAFLVAYAVPAFFVNVIAGGMASALVPALVRARESSGKGGEASLLGSTLVLALAVLLATTLALAVVGPPALRLLAPGFGPGQLAATRALFRLLLPLVALAGLAHIYGIVLNAGDRFALFAATPAFTPLAMIAFLFAAPALGVRALAIGVVVGQALELVTLAAAVRARGTPILPRWGGYTAPVRGVAAQYAPMVAGGLIDSSSPLVDQAVASLIGSGSIAALGYGSRLISLILGVIASSFVSVLFPHFATLVARRDVVALRRHLRRAIGVVVVVTVPLVAGLVVAGAPIVRLLFQRGAFDADMTATVASVQTMYALQLPFNLAAIVGIRALSALQANAAILRISVVILFANAGLDLALMKLMGVAGIALSTSLCFVLSAALVYFALAKRLGELA